MRARNSGSRDLAALEHVERMVAVLLGGAPHGRAEVLERQPRFVLVGEEAVLERRGEHPAEVADERVALTRRPGGSRRTISS